MSPADRAAHAAARATARATRAAALAGLLALAAGIAAAGAEEAAFSLGGGISQRSFAAGGLSSGAAWSYGGSSSFEARLSAQSGGARAVLDLEAAVHRGAAAAAAWFEAKSGASGDAVFAPAASLAGAEAPAAALSARVRGLYASLRGGGLKATLGRQVLNFGKGRLFSPADLFAEAEYSPLAIARRGTDALRLTAELGPLALAEAIAAPAGDLASGRYALRAAGFVAGAADCSVIGAWNGEEGTWVAGGDAKLDLPFAAVYGEAVAAFPRDSGDAVYRAAVGFDASAGDLVAAAEYRYDGAPAEGAAYGAHGLYAALSLGLSEYASLSASGLWLVDRDSWSGGLLGKAEIEQGVFLGLSAAATRTLPAGIETWSAEAGFSLELRF